MCEVAETALQNDSSEEEWENEGEKETDGKEMGKASQM